MLSVLRRGKQFHKLIKEERLAETKDEIPCPERTTWRVSGRNGRVDILAEELGDYVSVVEIKASDWDSVAPANVRRNARRQIRQIWSYIEAQLDIYGLEVCPGVISPKRPSDSAPLGLLESMFLEEGIQVIWHDESLNQLKKRMAAAS